MFEEPARHPDWPADQADRWYQAPAGGLNLNDNCLDVQIELHGGRIRVHTQPDVPAKLIDNQLKPGKKQRPTIGRRPGSEVFRLRGTVARSDSLRAASAHQPTVFFGQALQRALEQRGIEIRGQVVVKPATPGSTPPAVLVATQTTTLPDVLWRCNKFSQNMFAECLLKSLAAYNPDGQRNGTPGSWDAGRGVLKKTLADLGVDLRGAQIRDGSGLSHSNRATANQIVRLLVRMRHHRHADVFLASLAEPGQPGSMRNRYNDPALLGRLRGKTGTINGVRTLAGYIERPSGQVLAFALLINGKAERTLPTQVCRIIVGAE